MISIFKNWEILHPAYKNNKSSTGSYIKVIEEPSQRGFYIYFGLCGHLALWNIWKWHPSQWDNKQDAAPIM